MKWKLTPRTISLLIILAVFVSALTARRFGLLQFLEFRAYDYFLRHQAPLANGDPIVLVEMTEEDIQSEDLDYPLTNQKLAELLEILLADQPAVVGLDIWRDVSVPKNKAHLSELNEVFLSHTNLIAIYTLGPSDPASSPGKNFIAPPAALAPYPDRLGFNDNFPPDEHVEHTTPKVRRSMLFAKAETGQRLDAFPFRVASVYLRQFGVTPEIESADSSQFRLGKAEIRALQPNDGPYVGADTGTMQILLDFKSPTNFTRFSVGEALAGKIPRGSLRQKIVLIGMNAPSVSDERVTPIRRDHRGMELQSITIYSLLRAALNGDSQTRFWDDWLEDTWMLAWCLMGGAIGYRVRSPWRFVAAILLGLAILSAIGWQSLASGWWIPVAAPAMAFLPAVTLATSFISFKEHQNRDQLMKLFSNQVSPDIAQALWEQRDEFLAGNRPRSQKLTATVLFTDLKGFTTTSEGLEPEDLMNWLNEYMEVMANRVMAHRGVVEKYIGDSLMAVFGVPIRRTSTEEITEDARNAVRCALEMGQEMVKLNAIWKERGLPRGMTRVGIHTGPLVAGSLGSAERQEYTVIGDSVNIASRLESFDKDSLDSNLRDDCRILISEATKLLLDDNFRTQAIGKLTLKGKSDEVMVYAVLAYTTLGPGG